MELKILCDCGQNYAFDVEPVAGQMPCFINCPSCGKDGTATANSVLAQTPEIPTIEPKLSGGPLRVAFSQPTTQPTIVIQPSAPPPRPIAPDVKFSPAQRAWEKADMTVVHSLGLGILGAIIGATIGVALMFAFAMLVGIIFPFMGLVIGGLSGFGARLLYKGTDVPLGVAAGVVTLIATGGTFLLLFGIFAIINLVALMVSVAIAYKIAG